MPTVQIGNVESGDTIPWTYSIEVEYDNKSGLASKLHLVGPSPQPASKNIAADTKGSKTFTLANTEDQVEITLAAPMIDTTTDIQTAIGDVDDVTISNTPDVEFDANSLSFELFKELFPAPAVNAAIDPTVAFSGKYVPSAVPANDVVTIVVQLRGNKQRRRIVYMKATTLNAAAGTWAADAIPGAVFTQGRVYFIRAIFTISGRVKATASRKYVGP